MFDQTPNSARLFGHVPLFSTVIALLLGACTSGGGPGGGSGEPVTATISPDGGTILAEDVRGAEFLLEVPAGAVHAPLELTVTPVASPDGSLARFEVEPAGVWFEEPVDVTITFPPGTELSDEVTLVLGPETEPVFLTSQLAPGGRSVTAQVRMLSLTPDLSFQGASFSGATSERHLQPPSPPEDSVLVPQQGDGGTDAVAAVEAGCASRLESARETFDSFLATNSYEAALRLSINSGSLASMCGDVEEVGDWLANAGVAACEQYEELELIARTFAADTYDRYVELISPLLHWEAELQVLGLDCSADLFDLLQEKSVQFVTFYSSTVADSFSSDYEELVDEVNKVWTKRGHMELLGLSDAEQLLETQVLFPLMDLLRERSYEYCGQDDDHYYLSSLLESPFINRRVPIGTLSAAGALAPVGHADRTLAYRPSDNHASFGDADLHSDLQYCASNMEMEVWADSGVPFEVTDQRLQLAGGTGPGEMESSGEALGPYEGQVYLSGEIAAFRCGQARSIESDALVFRFEGNEQERRDHQGGELLPVRQELDLSDISDSAGLDPDALNTGELALERDGGGCEGLYGDHPFEIFTIDLTIDPVPSLTALSSSVSGLVAEEATDVTFTLPYRDDGTNLSRLEIEFELGEAVQPVTVDLATSSDAEGFDSESGNGTYQTSILVHCSEAGNNPLNVTIRLLDEFEQESDEASTAMTVNYSECDGASDVPSSVPFEVTDVR